ncbi:MAG: hypothetical protein M0R77_14555 [Gammaproteobacteria bacterium]|nr:hypothetical protein [Gammaproteobacteria bacterium]
MSMRYARSRLALAGLCLVAASVQAAQEEEPKVVSGISIVGNNETPKSLVIVPWKGSDVGNDSELTSHLLDDGLVPVDKEVFMRELRYYELSNP